MAVSKMPASRIWCGKAFNSTPTVGVKDDRKPTPHDSKKAGVDTYSVPENAEGASDNSVKREARGVQIEDGGGEKC